MPIVDIEGVEVEFPDMPPAQLEAAVRSAYAQMRAGRRDSAAELEQKLASQRPSLPEQAGTGARLLAGIGAGMMGAGHSLLNTFNDAAEAVEQVPGVLALGNAIGLPTTAEARAPADARRQRFQAESGPAMATTAGKVGNVIGTAALLAPIALIPGANTYTGAAAIGAGTGAALSEKGDRTTGAAIGAAGGVAGKYVGDKATAIVKRGIDAMRGSRSIEQARATLQAVLRENGMNLSDLPAKAQADLLEEARKAIAVGAELDPAALSRKADFLALGAKPTTAMVSRDPQAFAFEQTLKGVQGAGADLADVYNTNNRVLIDSLNKAGAEKAPGALGAGREVVGGLDDYVSRQRANIGNLYDAAKGSAGRAVELDPQAFATRAGELLDADMRNAFLPADIRNMLNAFAKGEVPLNVNTAEQFKTILASAQRGTQDGNAKAALGLVRQALDETPAAGQLGDDAIAAFNKARAANREFMGQVESIPALKAVYEGVEPDRFFQRHVLGANVADLRKATELLKSTRPESLAAVKAQMVDHLKEKALNGASDEVGTFSQAAFNKALKQVGKDRLAAAGFTPDEIAQLELVGRVASYTQSAPAGSVVNRSGTSAQSYNLLMRVLANVERVPVLGPLSAAGPLQGGVKNLAAGSALKAPVPAIGPQNGGFPAAMGPAVSASILNELLNPQRRQQQ